MSFAFFARTSADFAAAFLARAVRSSGVIEAAAAGLVEIFIKELESLPPYQDSLWNAPAYKLIHDLLRNHFQRKYPELGYFKKTSDIPNGDGERYARLLEGAAFTGEQMTRLQLREAEKLLRKVADTHGSLQRQIEQRSR